MIILDASVLIAHLDATDVHHDEARTLLTDAGAEELGASVITLAEVMVAPARSGRLQNAQDVIDRLGIIEISPSSHAAQRLAELRATTGLKMPDCCVLAAAEQAGGRVATFDRALGRAAQELDLT